MTKILKKKSIYITLIITLAFIILTNVIYQIKMNWDSDYLDNEIAFYEEQLKELNPKLASDKEQYVDAKSNLEMDQLLKQYGGTNTWQGEIIRTKIYSYIYTLNCHEYGVGEVALEEFTQAKQTYEKMLEQLKNDDWKAFAMADRQEITIQLKQAKEELAQAKSVNAEKKVIESLEEQVKTLETSKQVAEWRIEKNISYDSGYLNDALSVYESGSSQIRNYEKENDQKEYNEKLQYYQTLKDVNIAKYDIEHETTSGKANDGRGVLLRTFDEYEIFIIIMIVMIAGSIVSEEFSKGTIKLLLIKPYKRTTILTAKFITCIIMLLIVILLVMGMQFVVGGIITGFDKYQTPAVVYNYNTHQIQEMSLISYLAQLTVAKLPIYILLMTLAFALSTLFNHTALSITIALLGYMGSSIINMLAIQFKLQFLKFFVTPNWDLSQYLFGNIPQFQYISLSLSIGVCIAYFIIMLIPTYMVFKKKNIKNI